MTPVEAATPRAWRRAGWLLLLLGSVWLALGVVAFAYVRSLPPPAPDPNDMGAGAVAAPIAMALFVAIATAPSALFILIGALTLKTRAAAPFALGLCALAMNRGGAMLADQWVQSGSTEGSRFPALGIIACVAALGLLVVATALLMNRPCVPHGQGGASLRLAPRLVGARRRHPDGDDARSTCAEEITGRPGPARAAFELDADPASQARWWTRAR